MTRDDVLKEYGSEHYRYNLLAAWIAMADEIVRLRSILAALKEPSDAIIVAMQEGDSYGQTRDDDCVTMLYAAVAAAEKAVTT